MNKDMLKVSNKPPEKQMLRQKHRIFTNDSEQKFILCKRSKQIIGKQSTNLNLWSNIGISLIVITE